MLLRSAAQLVLVIICTAHASELEAVAAEALSLAPPARAPSQVLILGAHHTGTSIVSHALSLLGLWAGDQADLLIDPSNPAKFWERRDVVHVNKQRLQQRTNKSSTAALPEFVGYGFDGMQRGAINEMPEARAIVSRLNAHRPWLVKDPRLSLVASEWLRLLDHKVVCVLTVRHPLDFANTMMRYSTTASLSVWTDVWQKYMTSALAQCDGHHIALVDHERLVREPAAALESLAAQLRSLGLPLHRMDSHELIAALKLDPAPPQPTWLAGELARLSPESLRLYAELASRLADPPHERSHPHTRSAVAAAGWGGMRTAHPAGEAFATLLTSDDVRYLAAALVLGTSVRALDGAKREMVLLATPDVPLEWSAELTRVGWKMRWVQPIAEFWWNAHTRCADFEPDQAVRWGKMMTKLRLWQLTQYKKVLYLDADAVLTADPNALFEFDGFAAEAGVAHSGFNAGVMALLPSLETFAALLERGQGPPPHLFNSVVDCTEQALLNAHFDGSSPSRSAAMFAVAHPLTTDGVPNAATAVAHFITLACPKPWDHRPSTAMPPLADCGAALYEYWWRLYNRTHSSALATAPTQHSFVRRLFEYGGCSSGCPDAWVDDGICDFACNVEECKYDGRDCFHSAGECWAEADGKDYRGKVAVTVNGRACQYWSDQEPYHHTKTTMNYPGAGLGGHNFCRNPDGEDGPWCYTLDFPGHRWELCDVGVKAEACDAASPGHALGGGSAAPKVAAPVDSSLLQLGVFADGHVKEAELLSYHAYLPPSVSGIKVVLVPINGDADLFISFTVSKPDRRTATWTQESVGVKQFTLDAREQSADWCNAFSAANSSGCSLYLSVSGFEEGDFKLVVYNYTSTTLSPSFTAACSPGCDELRLGNTICDVACNTSACVWDSGDCGYYGEYELEDLCSAGCPLSWLGDGYCDEACYNSACQWDLDDCISADSGCADGCLPSYIDDHECDEVCNNEACGWDGTDCDHDADECYEEEDGRDYRGSRSVTLSGYECQYWSHQTPNVHTRTHMAHPQDGLGGHNHCRNPDGEEAHPWCYTMQPGVRFELCAAPPPSKNCTIKASQDPYHYFTLCPVDCAPILGNGLCERRCNISSCAYDRGDCGIGLALGDIFEGYTPVKTGSLYILVGSGVLVGVLIGLLILRVVLSHKKVQDEKSRGYTDAERKGMDNVHPDDLAEDF